MKNTLIAPETGLTHEDVMISLEERQIIQNPVIERVVERMVEMEEIRKTSPKPPSYYGNGGAEGTKGW